MWSRPYFLMASTLKAKSITEIEKSNNLFHYTFQSQRFNRKNYMLFIAF